MADAALGIDEPFPHVAQLDHLKRLQVPIHPQVARALGVTWADEHTKYSYEGRVLTWKATPEPISRITGDRQ